MYEHIASFSAVPLYKWFSVTGFSSAYMKTPALFLAWEQSPHEKPLWVHDNSLAS